MPMIAWKLLGLAAISQPQPQIPERQILIHSNEMDPISVESLQTQSRIGDEPVEIFVGRKNKNGINSLELLATSKGIVIGKYDIPLANTPNLDLGSIKYYGRKDAVIILKIEFRYGSENECYANDDGRNRFTAVFVQGKSSEGYTISYKDCEPHVTVL